jgi:hypothetical protein
VSRIYRDSMQFIHSPARINRIHESMEARGDKLCAGVFTVGEVLTGWYERDALEIASQVREA